MAQRIEVRCGERATKASNRRSGWEDNARVNAVTRVYRRANVSGTLASLTSTAALLLFGARESQSVFAPVNAISHWLWGERAIPQRAFSWRYTVLGYFIHHAMSIMWAGAYEYWVHVLSRERGPRASRFHPPGARALRFSDRAPLSDVPGLNDTRPKRRTADDATELCTDAPPQNFQHRAAEASVVLGVAAAVTTVACFVDLRCTPKRFTPGFERKLGAASLALVYVAFGAGLALRGPRRGAEGGATMAHNYAKN